MAFDGNGNFSFPFLWANFTGQVIDSADMDTQFANATSGFNLCLTRDGQGKPSVNLDWNGKRITNMGEGVAGTDAATYGQVTGVTTGNAFRRNMLVNGGMDVWQSGAGGSASVAGTAARIRTADCWWAVRDTVQAGYTVSQQAGEVNRYALKWQRDNANASVVAMNLGQSLETADCTWLKRGTPPAMYLSFYAKKGANYSGGDLTASVIQGTGTDQNVLAGFTGASTVGTVAATLTAGLSRWSFAVTPTTSCTQLGVKFSWTPTGAAGADDSVTIENVQLEVADNDTDFEYLPFAETLARCMRYYEKSFAYGSVPQQNGGAAGHYLPAFVAGVNGPGFLTFNFSMPKRANCTMTAYNPAVANAQVRNLTRNNDCSGTGVQMQANLNNFTFTWFGSGTTAVGDLLGVDWTAEDPNF